MTANTKTLLYRNRVLIEKKVIVKSQKMEVFGKDHYSFLFFKEKGLQLLNPDKGNCINDSKYINDNEGVLLEDGMFTFELKDKNEVEVIRIYLYPDILKCLYENKVNAREECGLPNSLQLITTQLLFSKFIESLELYFQYSCLASDEILEVKIRELILLLEQNKNIKSPMDLIPDFTSSML